MENKHRIDKATNPEAIERDSRSELERCRVTRDVRVGTTIHSGPLYVDPKFLKPGYKYVFKNDEPGVIETYINILKFTQVTGDQGEPIRRPVHGARSANYAYLLRLPAAEWDRRKQEDRDNAKRARTISDKELRAKVLMQGITRGDVEITQKNLNLADSFNEFQSDN